MDRTRCSGDEEEHMDKENKVTPCTPLRGAYQASPRQAVRPSRFSRQGEQVNNDHLYCIWEMDIAKSRKGQSQKALQFPPARHTSRQEKQKHVNGARSGRSGQTCSTILSE